MAGQQVVRASCHHEAVVEVVPSPGGQVRVALALGLSLPELMRGRCLFVTQSAA